MEFGVHGMGIENEAQILGVGQWIMKGDTAPNRLISLAPGSDALEPLGQREEVNG